MPRRTASARRSICSALGELARTRRALSPRTRETGFRRPARSIQLKHLLNMPRIGSPGMLSWVKSVHTPSSYANQAEGCSANVPRRVTASGANELCRNVGSWPTAGGLELQLCRCGNGGAGLVVGQLRSEPADRFGSRAASRSFDRSTVQLPFRVASSRADVRDNPDSTEMEWTPPLLPR